MPKAAIFDVDGTLLDSLDLHAVAWHEAMVRFGHDVSFEQARGQIRKGGDKLIPVFLSEEEERTTAKNLMPGQRTFQSQVSASDPAVLRRAGAAATVSGLRSPDRHSLIGQKGRA